MRSPSLPLASPVSCLLVSALRWAWAENSSASLRSAAGICTWPKALAKSSLRWLSLLTVLTLLVVEAAALVAPVSIAEVVLCAFFILFCCRFKYNGLLLSFRARLIFPFGLFLHVSGGSFSLSLAVPFFSMVDLLNLFPQVESPHSVTGSFVPTKQ